ncbi:MAG: flagellar hook capping FlgD N-terminal domain-containing protein [bacterium]|nr:flagellar hook capping FlgD N-terminal domain-containing protein [bacterium]
MDKVNTVKGNITPVDVNPKTQPKNSVKNMGKDEFLKILVTQLSHQDPLQPMEDREFIAQMAQFSALEQMISMNNNMSKMNSTSELNRAFLFLGKTVKVMDPKSGQVLTGKADEIDLSKPNEIGIRINNKVYKLEQIVGITSGEGNNLNTDKKVEK